MATRTSCDECVYWDAFSRKRNFGNDDENTIEELEYFTVGLCRRRAPSGLGVETQDEVRGQRGANFPMTNTDDWCGEGEKHKESKNNKIMFARQKLSDALEYDEENISNEDVDLVEPFHDLNNYEIYKMGEAGLKKLGATDDQVEVVERAFKTFGLRIHKNGYEKIY